MFLGIQNVLGHYLSIKKLDEFKKTFTVMKSVENPQFNPFLVAKAAVDGNAWSGLKGIKRLTVFRFCGSWGMK